MCAVGFAGSFWSCSAIQGGSLLLAMFVFYHAYDTWPLPRLSRSTGYGLVDTHTAVVFYLSRSKRAQPSVSPCILTRRVRLISVCSSCYQSLQGMCHKPQLPAFAVPFTWREEAAKQLSRLGRTEPRHIYLPFHLGFCLLGTGPEGPELKG